MAFVPQYKGVNRYGWPGLWFSRWHPSLSEYRWDPSYQNGVMCDTGGPGVQWIDQHSPSVLHIQQQPHDGVCEIFGPPGRWAHMVAASNWNMRDDYTDRVSKFLEFIERFL
jgi:hypothetical protein